MYLSTSTSTLKIYLSKVLKYMPSSDIQFIYLSYLHVTCEPTFIKNNKSRTLACGFPDNISLGSAVLHFLGFGLGGVSKPNNFSHPSSKLGRGYRVGVPEGSELGGSNTGVAGTGGSNPGGNTTASGGTGSSVSGGRITESGSTGGSGTGEDELGNGNLADDGNPDNDSRDYPMYNGLTLKAEGVEIRRDQNYFT